MLHLHSLKLCGDKQNCIKLHVLALEEMHVHNRTTFAQPQKHTQTTARSHKREHTLTSARSRQDKTNEDCISFTRQRRQALIKHACHVFPGYLPPRTHSHTQNNTNTGCKEVPICAWLACSIILGQAIILSRFACKHSGHNTSAG